MLRNRLSPALISTPSKPLERRYSASSTSFLVAFLLLLLHFIERRLSDVRNTRDHLELRGRKERSEQGMRMCDPSTSAASVMMTIFGSGSC